MGSIDKIYQVLELLKPFNSWLSLLGIKHSHQSGSQLNKQILFLFESNELLFSKNLQICDQLFDDKGFAKSKIESQLSVLSN
jgi:hypothetical protein